MRRGGAKEKKKRSSTGGEEASDSPKSTSAAYPISALVNQDTRARERVLNLIEGRAVPMEEPELLIRARLLVQSSPPTWPPGQFLGDALLAGPPYLKALPA